jgi:peptidoglycan/xylan/chitin deacetylase (PgdA/CDA1 family)
MKPVLMIHEIREEFFDLPLENYVLTFDDGLYSQYYYYPKFKDIPTEKIYFISSGIICKDHQSTEFPSCEIAHEKAFSGNYEDFMTLEQIKELMKDPLVTIGGHGHHHKRLKDIFKITHKAMYVIEDTKMMMSWFRENLNISPTKFCFPYNDDNHGLYEPVLKTQGFTEFYGRERIAIESLLDNRKD